MEHNPIGMNEPEFIEVLGNEDDFVQILGVTPPQDGSEIEVTSVEIDDGESFFIDIEDISSFDNTDEQNVIDLNEGNAIDAPADDGITSDHSDMI